MVGKLLVRGMLAGLLAGFVAFGFARIVGEPRVDRAIAFESLHEHGEAAASDAPGLVHDHGHAHAGAAQADGDDDAVVSRSTQRGLGLLTGVAVYGTAMGGLFALVFAFAHGRLGPLRPRALALTLALLAYLVLIVVPAVKYPANPPAVGSGDTIGTRTALFFVMIAASIVCAAIGFAVRRRALAALGNWNGSTLGAVVFVVLVTAVQLALPTIDEVPAGFPGSLLWQFRVSALGLQLILWTVLGLVFGWLVERDARLPASSGAALRA
ncbi:CbtA family protein [Chitinasiproducens palmae]|uniref:Uncharacterized membrane protein, predicted cobalt tansporter CbtA n=1 Tax=Chitinasiproducens palmae TaxID=1770053 RepID=A0A1H2PSW4_9BURK|nr:CbtA family protein [Chitinasiproducens palmae]SDV49711.1 Uncharacterized membrane protein, predicted cobalt tansporter CbtA [Chitinasiproducens palmae]